MDNETKQVLSDSEKLRLLTEHEGWGLARAKLVDTVTDLSNISSIDMDTPEKIMLDIASNRKATAILFAWLSDIEGSVAQAKENISLPTSNRSYIVKED